MKTTILLLAFALAALYIFDRYLATRPFSRRDCEDYLQAEYGFMIAEAKRQKWISEQLEVILKRVS